MPCATVRSPRPACPLSNSFLVARTSYRTLLPSELVYLNRVVYVARAGTCTARSREYTPRPHAQGVFYPFLGPSSSSGVLSESRVFFFDVFDFGPTRPPRACPTPTPGSPPPRHGPQGGLQRDRPSHAPGPRRRRTGVESDPPKVWILCVYTTRVKYVGPYLYHVRANCGCARDQKYSTSSYNRDGDFSATGAAHAVMGCCDGEHRVAPSGTDTPLAAMDGTAASPVAG